MRTLMLRFAILFLAFFLFGTVGLATLTGKQSPGNTVMAKSMATPEPQFQAPQLPDEDSTMLSTILSGLTGFGGGGILLIFLIRRFIAGYDETQKKWEDRFEKITTKYDESISLMWEKWSDKYEKLSDYYDKIIDDVLIKVERHNEKLMGNIEETNDSLQDIKFELAKFKETAVSKDNCYTAHSSTSQELVRLREKVESLEKMVRAG